MSRTALVVNDQAPAPLKDASTANPQPARTREHAHLPTPDIALLSPSSQTTRQRSTSPPPAAPVAGPSSSTPARPRSGSISSNYHAAVTARRGQSTSPRMPSSASQAGSTSPRSLGPSDTFDAVVQASDPSHPDHHLWRKKFGAGTTRPSLSASNPTSTSHQDVRTTSLPSPSSNATFPRRRDQHASLSPSPSPCPSPSPSPNTAAELFFQRELERERVTRQRLSSFGEHLAASGSPSASGSAPVSTTAAAAAATTTASANVTAAHQGGGSAHHPLHRSGSTPPAFLAPQHTGSGGTPGAPGAPGSGAGAVKSLVAEYEEVAKRVDEEAARSLSRRASASSLGGGGGGGGGRKSDVSHVVHVHGSRGGGDGDGLRSSSDRERERGETAADASYRRDFLDDPRHPESFQAQQLSGALLDPILLQGALENVGTITAGESARRTRTRTRRQGGGGGEGGVGGGNDRLLLASTSGGATRQNSGRKSASRRASGTPLRNSATSAGPGHGSASRHGLGPSPVPPPRVTSTVGLAGLLPASASYPGFVPETVAELNAVAQAAAAAGAVVSRPRARTGETSYKTSSSAGGGGGVASLPHSPALGSRREGSANSNTTTPAGAGAGAGLEPSSSPSIGSGGTLGAPSRRLSARSLRSDVSHGTTSSSRVVHGLNLPPMPEVLPPRQSSMLHLLDGAGGGGSGSHGGGAGGGGGASAPQSPHSFTSSTLAVVGANTTSSPPNNIANSNANTNYTGTGNRPPVVGGSRSTSSHAAAAAVAAAAAAELTSPSLGKLAQLAAEMGPAAEESAGGRPSPGVGGNAGVPDIAVSPYATATATATGSRLIKHYVEREGEAQEEIRADAGGGGGGRKRASQLGSVASGRPSNSYSSYTADRRSMDEAAAASQPAPGWDGTGPAEELVIKQRARRRTVGSQRASSFLGSHTADSGVGVGAGIGSGTSLQSSIDPSLVGAGGGRPSFSSVRSSVWPHGVEGDPLPSAASHGHGYGLRPGMAAASLPAASTPAHAPAPAPGPPPATAPPPLPPGPPALRPSVSSPHSPAGALSPEHNSVRLSTYSSSAVSSSSRTRESMITARSSMSATNGHGLELDGLSAFSHGLASCASVAGEHPSAPPSKRGSGVSGPAGVPSVWIGPARAGDETEEDEFYDARSDEGDEGEDSSEEIILQRSRRHGGAAASAADRGRTSSRREQRAHKRSSVRSSVLSVQSTRNGTTLSSRAASPAKSAGTEQHGESDSAAAGHGPMLVNGPAGGHAAAAGGGGGAGGAGTTVPAQTSDGLLLPPVVLSGPSTKDLPGPPSSSSQHASTHLPPRRVIAPPLKRRSRTNLLAADAVDEDVETSSNSSNEAANSYAPHGFRRAGGGGGSSVSRHAGSRHGHGHTQGHGHDWLEPRWDAVVARSPVRRQNSAQVVVSSYGEIKSVEAVAPAPELAPEPEPEPTQPTSASTHTHTHTHTHTPTHTHRSSIHGPLLDVADLDPQSATFRQREEVARSKTMRRLAKVEAAAARRRLSLAAAEPGASSGPDALAGLQAPSGEGDGGEVGDATITPEWSNDVEQGEVPLAGSKVGDQEGKADPRAAIVTVTADVPAEADQNKQGGQADASGAPLVQAEAAPTGEGRDLVQAPQVKPQQQVQIEAPARKSLEMRLARRFGFGGADGNGTKRSSRGVEFADKVTMPSADDDANASPQPSSLGRRKGLAALFGRARRKSFAAPASTPASAPEPANVPPLPPSILQARQPSDSAIRTKTVNGAKGEAVQTSVPPTPPTIPASVSAPAGTHGLGFTFAEGGEAGTPSGTSRPDVLADGRTTPSGGGGSGGGRWRARLSSISSVRSPYLGRRTESPVPPMPALQHAAETGVDEEWRRNLLSDAVGLSLGLATPRTPRSESRSGYRSGEEPHTRPSTPARTRRPVTPLPTDDTDKQETIRKTLSPPLLSDDMEDEGEETNKIDTLLMDLDNGKLIDSVRKPAATVPSSKDMDRNASAQSEAGGVLRRARGSPTLLSTPAADSSSEDRAPSPEVSHRPMGVGSTGARVYSTILEDVPHQSRSGALWQQGGGTSGSTTRDSQPVAGMLSVDSSGAMWPGEGGGGGGGPDSIAAHSQMSRLRLGSQASLYGGGDLPSGHQSDAEGMPGDSHGRATPVAGYEALGRLSKSVDHHHTSGAGLGIGSDHRRGFEHMGATSLHGHGRTSNLGSRPPSSSGGGGGMLSGLKRRLRGRRQPEISALGIANVPLTNSQQLVPSTPSSYHAPSQPASSAHGYPGTSSLPMSFSGSHQQQSSFLAAQEATHRLVAAQRDLEFTPSLAHAHLPPESPVAMVPLPRPTSLYLRESSKGTQAPAEAVMRAGSDQVAGETSIEVLDASTTPAADRRRPSLANGGGGGGTSGQLPFSPASGLPAAPGQAPAQAGPVPASTSTSTSTSTQAQQRRPSGPSSDILAFDQKLRGYSTANSELARQIAARASSSGSYPAQAQVQAQAQGQAQGQARLGSGGDG